MAERRPSAPSDGLRLLCRFRCQPPTAVRRRCVVRCVRRRTELRRKPFGLRAAKHREEYSVAYMTYGCGAASCPSASARSRAHPAHPRAHAHAHACLSSKPAQRMLWSSGARREVRRLGTRLAATSAAQGPFTPVSSASREVLAFRRSGARSRFGPDRSCRSARCRATDARPDAQSCDNHGRSLFERRDVVLARPAQTQCVLRARRGPGVVRRSGASRRPATIRSQLARSRVM